MQFRNGHSTICDGCEYNHDGIGCGGHCLKELLIDTEGGNLYRMKLVIAEKPSQGRAFAKVLGATNERDGFMEGNGWVVSWCYGHLLRPAKPDEIDPELRHWRICRTYGASLHAGLGLRYCNRSCDELY